MGKALARRSAIGAIGAQIGIGIAGLLAVALTPPADGEMLLIPLTTGAAARLPALVLRDGTRLITRGRLAGSLVVRGERSRLGWPMLMNGILPLASARPGCVGATA